MDSQFRIGGLTLKNNILSAPLSGISDLVFREITTAYGAGLTYTGMISVSGLARQNRKTLHYLDLGKDCPVAVQLFGKNPEEFAKATDFLAEHSGFACIDINMGCPVRKVVSSGSGAALMRNLDLAKEIIELTVAKSPVPVTVKFRLGWDSQSLNFVELGKIAEQAGAAAVTLHARTRQQSYTGAADWTKIKELKQALKIPVIGNGDIKTRADIAAMLRQTGCDAVMVARASIGNPWIFAPTEVRPSLRQRIEVYLAHTRRLLQYRPANERQAIAEMRKFAARYISSFSGAAELRREINTIDDYAGLEKLLKPQLSTNYAHLLI
ncbi:tRNA-dihydrouridine synthase B [Candidatus Termititenax persephonae]|uniref:tRNA-dihydrouridine synthase n=1 Tax=Candidatus Termititenax persephonae TaxID=2218525 RepID=A0A388TEX8_9BACT|nr:tRNA-dihydrouridine synthase B [Candidatus Termititenax persephonae]